MRIMYATLINIKINLAMAITITNGRSNKVIIIRNAKQIIEIMKVRI